MIFRLGLGGISRIIINKQERMNLRAFKGEKMDTNWHSGAFFFKAERNMHFDFGLT